MFDNNYTTTPLGEWLVCPECGYDEFGSYDIPPQVDGRNTYLKCENPKCDARGVVVG